MTMTGYHPMGDGSPTGPPQQATVDESGQANITDAHYEGGQNNGNAATTNLPEPIAKVATPGAEPFAWDKIDLLDHLVMLHAKIDAMMERTSLAEDESIKRRMRGPLRSSSTYDDIGFASVTIGPVPAGEIWLIDRYIAVSEVEDDDTTPLCAVYDGSPFDPTSMIDSGSLETFIPSITSSVSLKMNVSDNTQPILLMPHASLTLQFFGITGLNVYARANYRSIAVNNQFAKGNADVV